MPPSLGSYLNNISSALSYSADTCQCLLYVQAVLLQSLLYNRKTREVNLLEVMETDPEFTPHSSLDFGALI